MASGDSVKERGSVCQRHQEPRELFCEDQEDHDAPICVVCDRLKEHKNHQDQIQKLLETRQKERKKILAYKAELESQDLLEKTQRVKEKTVTEFRNMHQFLEEQERHLLAQMEKVEKEISAKWEEHLARLSEEFSSLSKLIQEMEEKLQQPASELQDIRCFIQGYEDKEEFEAPAAFPPALKWKIWDIWDINPYLESVMKQFRDSLEFGLQQQKAHVTLDPDTAHPRLILSEDCRRVTWGEKQQDLPDNPERFKVYDFVLGREGFTGGRHFWEVLVGSEERWSVGVARKSVQRKDLIPPGPDAGIWEVGKCWSEYCFSPDKDTFLCQSLSKDSKGVRVTLNYEGGRVAFYDAETAALIFEYPPTSFSGETLLPFFYVKGKAQLALSP